MQRPTDTLAAEHAVVDRGLGVLLSIARHVGGHGAFPTTDVAILLRFLREFVLGVHLRKDAEVVWPALVMHGDERTAGLVGDLCRLHDDVTELVHSLVLFWEPVGDLSAAEREGLVETVRELATRIRRMQALEEGDLIPACHAVPPDDRLEWIHRFAELDRGRDGVAAWSRRLTRLESAWPS